jgi:hypothetical protein
LRNKRVFLRLINIVLSHRSYLSYGLKIASFVPLTGLVTSDVEPDVSIERGSVREDCRYSDFDIKNLVYRPGLSVRASSEFFIIDWGDIGICLIEAGTKVTIEAGKGVDEKDLIPLITGPILAVILHQRGKLVLHASAVNIGGKAAVFLGNKGYGKSTLAAHLQSRGHPLISDDMVPVFFNGEAAQTVPGYPQIRLLPDAVESIGLDPGTLQQVNTWIPKRHFVPDGVFTAEPIEIGCIFILAMSDSVSLQELNPYSAFIEIANNTYTGAFLRETENVGAHFKLCEQLVKSVPVSTLSRPHDFTRMSEIVDLITNAASSFSR